MLPDRLKDKAAACDLKPFCACCLIAMMTCFHGQKMQLSILYLTGKLAVMTMLPDSLRDIAAAYDLKSCCASCFSVRPAKFPA